MNRCPNCGACKECGHGGVKMIPYPVPAPYPVYPRPVSPWPYNRPVWISQPMRWTGGNSAQIVNSTAGPTLT